MSPLSVPACTRARQPLPFFSFFNPSMLRLAAGRTVTDSRRTRFSEAGAHTWLRTNKWDETDDTAYIVLRHIPCQPGRIMLSLYSWPPRVLRSPISTTVSPLGLQPLTPAKHPLIGCRFTFSLLPFSQVVTTSRRWIISTTSSSLQLEPKFFRKMRKM